MYVIGGSNAAEALDPRYGVRERYPVRGRRQTADHKPDWWYMSRKGADDNGHMAEEPRAWKARTRGSEAEVDGVIRPSTVTIIRVGVKRRFSPAWRTCTT